MKIVVTAPGQFQSLTSDEPEPGMVYELQDGVEGTDAQNRAFHALVQEYWRTGCHSYNAKNIMEFRNMIKRHLGAGFEAFVYAVIEDGKPVIRDAKTYKDIPEAVRTDPDLKKLVRGRLKSWSDYTKRERTETIDRLIAEMEEAGVQTKKFYEILEGMQGWRQAS
jgi:hypothetical protein